MGHAQGKVSNERVMESPTRVLPPDLHSGIRWPPRVELGYLPMTPRMVFTYFYGIAG